MSDSLEINRALASYENIVSMNTISRMEIGANSIS